MRAQRVVYRFCSRVLWTWFTVLVFFRHARVTFRGFAHFAYCYRVVTHIPQMWKGTALVGIANTQHNFEHLGLPGVGGSTLHTYPFSWTGVVALHRLVVKSHYFLRWETIQKYYPDLAAQVNAQLPFYLASELVREGCFFSSEIAVSARLLQQLDPLLLAGFNNFLFTQVERDPFLIFHLFFDATYQQKVIYRYLDEYVPYLLTQYRTVRYLEQLRQITPTANAADFTVYWLADFSWSSLFYHLALERMSFFLYWETLWSRVAGFGHLPFYSFWSRPLHFLGVSEVFLMGIPFALGCWFFFYSLLDVLAHRFEPTRRVSGPATPDFPSLPVFSMAYWRHFSVAALFRFAQRVFNLQVPDNFMLYFSSARLKWRQDFISKNPIKFSMVREVDLAGSLLFLVFLVRGVDYFRFSYKKRDFRRVVRRFRKIADRRYESQHRTAVSPVLALAEASEGRVFRTGFVPLRKADDFPLVWASRLGRHAWVPYRARKRLVTTQRLELLLTRYLGRLNRQRFARSKTGRTHSRLYRKLRRRAVHDQSSRRSRFRRLYHHRRGFALAHGIRALRKSEASVQLRPRLYAGYLRAGSDQRLDLFTLVDPTDTFLFWDHLRINDNGFVLPYYHQWQFDQGYDCCEAMQGCASGELLLDVDGRAVVGASGAGTWLGFTTPEDELFGDFHRSRGVFFDTSDVFVAEHIEQWVNLYRRQAGVNAELYARLKTQRWRIANELLNTLFLQTITQDRARSLQPHSPGASARFTRYFSFYSKQLRYNFGLQQFRFPFIITERLAAVTQYGSTGKFRADGFRGQKLPALSTLTGNYFSRFQQVSWRRVPRVRRMRYVKKNRFYRSVIKRRRIRQYGRGSRAVRARSWKRLLRHKHIWRTTQALHTARNVFLPDETQRLRQKGAVYGFLVPSRTFSPASRFFLGRKALRRLLFTKQRAKKKRLKTSLLVQRRVEKKLLRLSLVRRRRVWRQRGQKYALSALPKTRGEYRVVQFRRVRKKLQRLFFYPWRQDKKKGLLAGTPHFFARIRRLVGGGTLARLSLRVQKNKQIVVEHMGKRLRPRIKRWKPRRRLRRHGNLRGVLRKKIDEKGTARFAKQEAFKREFRWGTGSRAPFGWRWRRSVHRRQLAVLKARRPYGFWYRSKSWQSRQQSAFYSALKRRGSLAVLKKPLEFIIPEAPPKEDPHYSSFTDGFAGSAQDSRRRKKKNRPKGVPAITSKDFQRALSAERALAVRLRETPLFRSPLIDSFSLQQLKRRAVEKLGARHRQQYLVLRRHFRLMHSLPFFRTNRHVLRNWAAVPSITGGFRPAVTSARRLVIDLHQKLKFSPLFLPADVAVAANRVVGFVASKKEHLLARVGAAAEVRLVHYYSQRFSRFARLPPGSLSAVKKTAAFADTWGALYYSFGQSRGSQYFKIVAPQLSFSRAVPLLWNETTLSDRFSLRTYFADVARVVGDRPMPRNIMRSIDPAEMSLGAPHRDFYVGRSLFARVLVRLKRRHRAAVTSRQSGFFAQTYDDRLWHAIPYRLSKDHPRGFYRRMVKRRYAIVEFLRKDWFELYNDYCHDWAASQLVNRGQDSDIIDTDFLVQTRGFDPHFKLIKRADVSDLAVLAETYAYQFKVASLFPLFVNPWRSGFRQRTHIRMLAKVEPSVNHQFFVRRYRRTWGARLRRHMRLLPSWARFRRVRTLLGVRFLVAGSSAVPGYKRQSLFSFRRSLRGRRVMTLFRGRPGDYPGFELWKIRRRRTMRFLGRIRRRSSQRKLGLVKKLNFIRGRRRATRSAQRPHFRFRGNRRGHQSRRFRLRTRRLLRSTGRRQMAVYPVKSNRRQRFYSYRSTRKRAPVLYRSSMFAKTKYLASYQQDLLGPQLLQYIRPAKLSRLFVPSTFLARRQRLRPRFYRKRYLRATGAKALLFTKRHNRFRGSRRTQRMRWLRNRAVRFLRRAYLKPEFDKSAYVSFFGGRLRPHQFKIVPVDQLPVRNARSTVLTVHNFSEYTTPKWRDLFGVLDSFIYYDYRYAGQKAALPPTTPVDPVSDQANWLRRNGYSIDEDLLSSTGTLGQEFETRVFGHRLARQTHWDLIPFTIDARLKGTRPRFTWLHRYLAQALGTRLFRRKSKTKAARRRKHNRLLWLLFYEQFISNSVVKRNFGRFLRWHRLSRQLHITWHRRRWQFRKRRARHRGPRFRAKRKLFLFRNFYLGKFRIRFKRRPLAVSQGPFRNGVERRARLLFRRGRGKRNRTILVATRGVRFRPAHLRPLSLPAMRYGFWARMRQFQNRVRLGDSLNFVQFRVNATAAPAQYAAHFGVRFQLAVNLFEYRKFVNRLRGRVTRRPQSVFFGRNSWKLRPFWFNADATLFDSPLSRGQRVGRSWRRIGGHRRSARKAQRSQFSALFRRSAFVLNLVRGSQEVRASYLHRFSNRFSLRARRHTAFPTSRRFFQRMKFSSSVRVRRRFERAQAPVVPVVVNRSVLGTPSAEALGITQPMWLLKTKFLRSRGRRLSFYARRRRRLRGLSKHARRWVLKSKYSGHLRGLRLRALTSQVGGPRGPRVSRERRRRGRSLYAITQMRRRQGPWALTVKGLDLAYQQLRPHLIVPQVRRSRQSAQVIAPTEKQVIQVQHLRSSWQRAALYRYTRDAAHRLLRRQRKAYALRNALRKRPLTTRYLRLYTAYTHSVLRRRTRRRMRRFVVRGKGPKLYKSTRSPDFVVVKPRRGVAARKKQRLRGKSLRFYRHKFQRRKRRRFRRHLRSQYLAKVEKRERAFKMQAKFYLVRTRRANRFGRRIGTSVRAFRREGLSWYLARPAPERFARWRVKRFLPALWRRISERQKAFSQTVNRYPDRQARLRSQDYLRDLPSERVGPSVDEVLDYHADKLTTLRLVRRLRVHLWVRQDMRLDAYWRKIMAEYRIIQKRLEEARIAREKARAAAKEVPAFVAKHKFLLKTDVVYDASGNPSLLRTVNTQINKNLQDRSRDRTRPVFHVAEQGRSIIGAMQRALAPVELIGEPRPRPRPAPATPVYGFTEFERDLKRDWFDAHGTILSSSSDSEFSDYYGSDDLEYILGYESSVSSDSGVGELAEILWSSARSKLEEYEEEFWMGLGPKSPLFSDSEDDLIGYHARKPEPKLSPEDQRLVNSYDDPDLFVRFTFLRKWGLTSRAHQKNYRRKKAGLISRLYSLKSLRAHEFRASGLTSRNGRLTAAFNRRFRRLAFSRSEFGGDRWFRRYSRRIDGLPPVRERALRKTTLVRLWPVRVTRGWPIAQVGARIKRRFRVIVPLRHPRPPRTRLPIRRRNLGRRFVLGRRGVRAKRKGKRWFSVLGHRRASVPRLRRVARRQRVWQRIVSTARRYDYTGKMKQFRRNYRGFRKRLKKQLLVRFFRKRHRKRFLLFRRRSRRHVVFQTRHKSRNFDWLTRRVPPRYLRDVVYLKGFENVTLPRVIGKENTVGNLSASVVVTGLDAFRAGELWANYRVSSIGGTVKDWLTLYTPRQQRLVVTAQAARGIPLGWTATLRRGDVVSATYTTGRWQAFADAFGLVNGRSSQVLLWVLSGYAAGKSLLSKELFVAQFLTQTLGLMTGTPGFDVSYVVSYWVSAWWDAFHLTFQSTRVPLVLPNTRGLEDPYVLQQLIRRYEMESAQRAWLDRLAVGLSRMTGIPLHHIQPPELPVAPRGASGRVSPSPYHVASAPAVFSEWVVAEGTSSRPTKLRTFVKPTNPGVQLRQILPRQFQVRNPITGEGLVIVDQLPRVSSVDGRPLRREGASDLNPVAIGPLLFTLRQRAAVVEAFLNPPAARVEEVPPEPVLSLPEKKQLHFSDSLSTFSFALKKTSPQQRLWANKGPRLSLQEVRALDRFQPGAAALAQEIRRLQQVNDAFLRVAQEWARRPSGEVPVASESEDRIESLLAPGGLPLVPEFLIYGRQAPAWSYEWVVDPVHGVQYLSPLLPPFFSSDGDPFRLENNVTNHFVVNGLVSAEENRWRRAAGLVPLPTHEEFRATVGVQWARELFIIRRMQAAAQELQAGFLAAGILPEYLPDPLTNDDELLTYICLPGTVTDKLAQEPFRSRLQASYVRQRLAIRPRSAVAMSAEDEGIPGHVFARTETGCSQALVYPSGVQASQGVLLDIPVSPEDLQAAHENVALELMRPGCSLAALEYVNERGEHPGRVVLPDWSFSDHPGYFGRPPRALRVPILDLPSQEGWMLGDPLFVYPVINRSVWRQPDLGASRLRASTYIIDPKLGSLFLGYSFGPGRLQKAVCSSHIIPKKNK